MMMKEFVYEQSGVVEKGMELGKPIGFPTANIHFDQPNISGTYAGLVWVGEREYRAAVYANQGRQLLEAYLFDFSGDLYGREIRVSLLEKVAEAAEFTSETDIQKFLQAAVDQVADYFRNE